ncbi:serine hydrolase [Flavobacterium paronense]|uniref:Serine hydrolase domain-containing protein n=1 Tax=Flavobacterium paronense TaxID=1392775 RepID=A0ABV5GCL9_9FLAO|nr:serine hydrolase [Flavobacterium paronense]MDN3676308.1 serine hydrolase [Flavobacterium paronense]
MKRLFTTLFFLTIFFAVSGQTSTDFADSIRIKYKIPELAFAVVSADTIFELQTLGVQRINTDFKAKPDDRFHIGSNTKAITAFISALLVAQGQIKWDTKFLDLFPELKEKSRKEYQDITLQDLLTFRGTLPAYTYTFDKPTKRQIKGDDAAQRFQLAKYFLSQKPMQIENGLTPSNADYILAGLMLEKVSKKSFKELVTDFGKTLGIVFGFDYPNLTDTLQPWGHDINLKPLPPFDNYKLNWLLSAGNINVSLTDYIKFIQLQLKGLKGQTKILSSQTFEKLLYGLPTFSFGWFNKFDTLTNHHIAYNEGNAGAFITRVQIIKETGKAFIIFTNSASTETSEGVTIIIEHLKKKYSK